jgi:hypothetical protein
MKAEQQMLVAPRRALDAHDPADRLGSSDPPFRIARTFVMATAGPVQRSPNTDLPLRCLARND